jgi:hypothetical protein
MITAITAVILFGCLVAVMLLGRYTRRYLPENHLSAESKDAIKLAMSLVATMTALLLGLLISSAKDTFDTVRGEVSQMAAKVAFLDRVLAAYGPDAADARAKCRDVVADAVQRMWPEERGGSAQMAPNEQAGDALYFAVIRLSPHDDVQRALKTQAATVMVDLAELRSLLQTQAIPSISRPLLLAVVSWLVVIFFCFSLVAPPNNTTTLALVASAFSVACALFLILELDHPLSGLIRVPSEPIVNVLNHLDK